MNSNKIILASNSPRRKDLLEQIGIEFKVHSPNFDEKSVRDNNPVNLVETLAYQKALSVARIYERSYIIGSDTVVVVDDKILEQPENEEHAAEMLRLLSNRKHQVITGYSIINISEDIFYKTHCITNVYFRKLTNKDIERYIATKEPLDKAGAYGIQGYAAQFIKKVEGCYFNIVGLPLEMLTNSFRKLKIDYT